MFRNGWGILALLMAPGTTPADCFSLPWSPEEVYDRLQGAAGRADLSRLLGRAIGIPDWVAFRRQVESAERCGVTLLPWCDPGYPDAFTHIAQPPPLLFVRGYTDSLGVCGVAVVGTRRPSPGGIALARRLGRDLSRAGITVVSGLARGIDTAAHLGALGGPGRGIAVLGTGIDVSYPAENAGLATDVCRNGCLVSEQWMGTPPSRHVFPRRNRLISALAHAVIVVEGSLRSGAMITARWALEQGRDVGAVPGFPGDFRSRGPNQLLREGAFLVEGVADVFDAIPRLRPPDRRDDKSGNPSRGPAAAVPLCVPEGTPGAEIRTVVGCLGVHPVSADEIANASGLGVASVQRALAWLEVEGIVRRDDGHRFARIDGLDGETESAPTSN